MESFQFVWELIFQEYATFRCTKIGATLPIEGVVEGFVYYTNSWPHIYTHTYHTSNMMKMTFGEALSTIEGIYPNDHLIFIELVWEFKKVPVRLRGHLPIYLLK